MVRIRYFVVTGSRKGVLCIWQWCGRRILGLGLDRLFGSGLGLGFGLAFGLGGSTVGQYRIQIPHKMVVGGVSFWVWVRVRVKSCVSRMRLNPPLIAYTSRTFACAPPSVPNLSDTAPRLTLTLTLTLILTFALARFVGHGPPA